MNWKVLRHIVFFVLLPSITISQSKINQFLTPSDTLNIPRRNGVIVSEASLATIALIGLNELWYADYERSSFHTINDNDAWMQMDKLGHAFTSYQLGKHGAQLLNWSGVSKKNQLIYGATLGFTFLTAVEILDGYSAEWGFSWGDVMANALGSGMYIGQELLWNEQRIAFKYSFHQTKYAELQPEKLGSTVLEQMLKDYNGQTYWLSFNLKAFFKTSRIPEWLNIGIGYGAEGMLSDTENIVNQYVTSKEAYRKYYLSLDINLNGIKTNSRVLSTVFDVFNMIKVPLPTLEFSEKGTVFHLFYF
ncbi:DUF2279 domain-containing protein [Algibacter mikhailovii]|uniref:DUF2279 domain-containing protein n=1 Tax=Algibacter mikhailovii TaxID=425498 RepID=A0A918QQR7_9FLAO|nr:DUF2279 domain-containing protein [Algibacter mikhailovii]GGZ67388.1 DUF2279 domain-containing protein [Algibacter mikhailovii]